MSVGEWQLGDDVAAFISEDTLTDQELVRLAAEKVMGGKYVKSSNGSSWAYALRLPDGTRRSGWNPLTSDSACWHLVDKLAPLAGSYHGGDGFFILCFGEWADHGEGDEDNPCTCGGLGEDDELPDKLAWSAHFHVGLMSEGPEYPPGWDNCAKFCARASDRRRAIVLACLRAVGAMHESPPQGVTER